MPLNSHSLVIVTSCISVLCVLMALGMFMCVNVMSSLMSVISPLLVCVPCLGVCAYCGVVTYFRCFRFMCEFCFLYCDFSYFIVNLIPLSLSLYYIVSTQQLNGVSSAYLEIG